MPFTQNLGADMAAYASHKLQHGVQVGHSAPCNCSWARLGQVPQRRAAGGYTHVLLPPPSTASPRAAALANTWQSFQHANGFEYEANGHGHAPSSQQRGGVPSDADGWMALLEANLSPADRVVLDLTQVAAHVSDKATADRVAAVHGLSLVTNSDVCVAPLLPPFGSTVDEDGEQGDGMALAPPREQLAGGPLRLPQAVGGGRGSSGGGFKLASLGLRPHAPSGSVKDAASALASTSPYAGRDDVETLVHLVAEGGGGDVSDDEGDANEFGPDETVRATSATGTGRLRSAGQAAGHSNGAKEVGAAQSLMGAAAAAFTRVARAASSAAELQAPVSRAAVDAATAAAAAAHAVEEAVARAARATSQMLPHYGDPSSTWVVADDPRGCVRYIVIAAGPDLRRRTTRELTADLVTFETYNLGAKVNKRLYAEATALYARFMPLVMDFLEAVPDGNICFGGQGVGGSLATLLQLMCCHRGLRFAKLLPAVAVDAPPVVCQVPLNQRRIWGPAGRDHQHLHDQDQLEDVLEELMSRTVLEELGLPQEAVRNLVLDHQSTQQHLAPHQQHQSHARDAVVVMAAADGEAANGQSGVADPARAQVFRLMGKIIHVPAAAGSASKAADASSVSPHPSGESSMAYNGVLETDGGSDGLAAVASREGVLGTGAGLGAGVRRLDVGMVGSIASAAATAAASYAVEHLRQVGRSAAAGAKPTAAAPAAVPATMAAAASAVADRARGARGVGPTAAAAMVMPAGGSRVLQVAHGGGFEYDNRDEQTDSEDTSAWGV